MNVDISKESVYKKLANLETGKSPGPDEIHGKLLFELRDQIAEPLANLFQSSFKTGCIPQDFKDAIVTPIYKKGSKNNVENYRPVSLTSIVGKIMESIIKDSIVKLVEDNKLLNATQHGFTSGKSCLINLLDFMEIVAKEVDMGNNVDLIYLDFAKAFDKVPHRRLLKKEKLMALVVIF